MTFSYMPVMGQDRVSGAAEIERDVIDRLAAVHREALPDLCEKILSRYPAMGSLWFIANSFLLGGDKASRAFKRVQQAGASIVNNAFSVLKDGMTVATYSRSSAVKDILVHNRRMICRVLCSESRPHFEGRRLAQELSHEGIPVTLTTDAGLFDQMITADLVLMGADAFVGTTIVNKERYRWFTIV